MKVYNRQTYTVSERSEIVDIKEKDIKKLRKFEAFPYEGNSEQDLADYVARFLDEVDNIEGDLPEILNEIYSKLKENVERTEIGCSLNKSGESQIVCTNDKDQELGSAEYYM